MDTAKAYAHFQEIPTRWKDNDIYGHVNNVEYYSYFDTVINTWLICHAGLDIHGGDAIGVCVESHCQYHGSIAFPGIVDAGIRVSKIGTSSVRYEIGLFRKGESDPVATGWFVHVFVDRNTRRPKRIADHMRTAMTGLVVTG